MQEDERLAEIRKRIDDLDAQIIELLKNRFTLAKEIGRIKGTADRAILQPGREQELIASRRALAKRAGLDVGFIEKLFREVMAASRKIQEEDAE